MLLKKRTTVWQFNFTFVKMYRVVSKPGISGNLEKSGNFVALEKSQGNVREFCEIQKSQGISMQNWEKSGNFTCAKRISLKSSRFIQVVNKN